MQWLEIISCKDTGEALDTAELIRALDTWSAISWSGVQSRERRIKFDEVAVLAWRTFDSRVIKASTKSIRKPESYARERTGKSFTR